MKVSRIKTDVLNNFADKQKELPQKHFLSRLIYLQNAFGFKKLNEYKRNAI